MSATVREKDVLWEDGVTTSQRPWPSDYTPGSWVRRVVGAHFHAWDGNVYKCVAYDPRNGFWMAQVNADADGPPHPPPT